MSNILLTIQNDELSDVKRCNPGWRVNSCILIGVSESLLSIHLGRGEGRRYILTFPSDYAPPPPPTPTLLVG